MLTPNTKETLRSLIAEGIVLVGGCVDVSAYLGDEAFGPLQDQAEFAKVFNGAYFVEWDGGADLSADTIEAKWRVVN